MIYAVDQNEDWTTCWHVPPPHPSASFVVIKDAWEDRNGRPYRDIYAWHYPDQGPDAQGWLPVPSWQRLVMSESP